jgi:hypothetical protein
MPKVAGRSGDVTNWRLSLYRVSGQVTSPCKEREVRECDLEVQPLCCPQHTSHVLTANGFKKYFLIQFSTNFRYNYKENIKKLVLVR